MPTAEVTLCDAMYYRDTIQVLKPVVIPRCMVASIRDFLALTMVANLAYFKRISKNTISTEDLES